MSHNRFYVALATLASCSPPRRLGECTGRLSWPQRGVYFFFEPGEERTRSGQGPRVVRVGTHALNAGARTTLWKRLSQHRGTARSSGGNHRGSVFRLLVGDALLAQRTEVHPSWGVRSRDNRQGHQPEQPVEAEVSAYLARMSVLWLPVLDEPGPSSLRGYFERNAIALLGDSSNPDWDPPSSAWLGSFSSRRKVVASGLWNQNHVGESCDAAFIARFEHHVQQGVRR